MTMNATVISIEAGGMLVRDNSSGQQVQVWYQRASSFRPGDSVRITYYGRMTMSIPPQITASQVVRTGSPEQPQPQPQPPERTSIQRAQVLQIQRGSLVVRDPSDQQRVVVNYPYAHHFCRGQRVNVIYDTITFSNPRQVSATEVTPVC